MGSEKIEDRPGGIKPPGFFINRNYASIKCAPLRKQRCSTFENNFFKSPLYENEKHSISNCNCYCILL